jgi:hypothetical protein
VAVFAGFLLFLAVCVFVVAMFRPAMGRVQLLALGLALLSLALFLGAGGRIVVEVVGA